MDNRIESALNETRAKANVSTDPKTSREHLAIEATLLLAEQTKRIADILDEFTCKDTDGIRSIITYPKD